MNSLTVSENSAETLQIVEKDGIQAVSARELHKGLGITDRFSRWFESLLKYGFSENEDFTSVKTSTLVNNGAERELDDYAVSLDMAKQICMLQRSEKGKQYRQYLINLEKAWNSPEKVMERALEIAHRKAEEATRRIMEMQPKAAVYDELVDRSKIINFRDMASKLGMSQTKFMAILKSKYIYKNSAGEYRAYAEYQEYFVLRTFFKNAKKTGEQLLLNMDGVSHFINLYLKEKKGDSVLSAEEKARIEKSAALTRSALEEFYANEKIGRAE